MSEITTETPKMSDYYRSTLKCPECQGLGYGEYESGLIRLPCLVCNGTGEIPDVSDSRVESDNQSTGIEDTSKPKLKRKSKKTKVA